MQFAAASSQEEAASGDASLSEIPGTHQKHVIF